MATSQSPFIRPPAELILFVGNDQYLSLVTLKDALTEVAIESAVVTAVVKDADGNPVAGIDNPLTLAHATGGTYRGVVPDTATLADGDRLIVEISANDGPGRQGFWVRKGVVHYA